MASSVSITLMSASVRVSIAIKAKLVGSWKLIREARPVLSQPPGTGSEVESDQDLQALFIYRSNGHIQSVSEARWRVSQMDRAVQLLP